MAGNLDPPAVLSCVSYTLICRWCPSSHVEALVEAARSGRGGEAPGLSDWRTRTTEQVIRAGWDCSSSPTSSAMSAKPEDDGLKP